MAVNRLLNLSSEEKELLFFIIGERTQNFWFPAASDKIGQMVDRSVVILDLKGVNVLGKGLKLRKLLKFSNRIAADFYPETLYKMLITHSGRIQKDLS